MKIEVKSTPPIRDKDIERRTNVGRMIQTELRCVCRGMGVSKRRAESYALD